MCKTYVVYASLYYGIKYKYDFGGRNNELLFEVKDN